MAVSNGSIARRYHDETKHSYESVRRSARGLDWANRPDPFKTYNDVEALDLPAEARPGGGPLALSELAWLLRWGAGVVRTRGDYSFRTYSSAGALYPVEVYVGVGEELPAELIRGVYHFHPGERALRRLRWLDPRPLLARAADDVALESAAAILVLTGIMWRTAWKYETRGYRHLWWDAGTMLANFLELADAARVETRVVTGFVDDEVNHLVGVDGVREAALALLAVGEAPPAARPDPPDPIEFDVAALSERELEYPLAHDVHAATRLASAEDVRRYRKADAALEAPPLRGSGLTVEQVERVLRRRGSVRDFSDEAVPVHELTAILAHAMGAIPADVPEYNVLYGVAHAVDGLASGVFRFDAPDSYEVLREGAFRRQAGYLVLEQPLGALAAVTLFLLADLEQVLTEHGDRGYRAVQLEAGIRAGRLQLGAVAQGLAATATTFYDDDVTEFLAPGTALTPMLAVAIGVDARYGRRPLA